ncbi:helix-turn-helix domain-containing protein [Vibrio sp. 10N.286.49.B3]|uniref:helix-turn-helix domain-containing protein n=1 Tax=Vibrio sp. 10N.286.49.B3 TaxID=1880855 RepID=UPI0012FFDFDF|nr:helix-turn-helix domain-containing protein [Vibrio sp. 10N.286.49.B3]
MAKLVLLKIADNANVHGHCFPSYGYLAKMCELSLRTVQKHVKGLEEKGLLTITHRHAKNGRQSSNLFILNLKEIERRSFAALGVDDAPSEVEADATIISHKESKDNNSFEMTFSATDGQYILSQTEYELWISCYPALEIEHELLAIHAWLESNPTKRKDLNGTKSFINAWLRRSQIKPATSKASSEHKKDNDSLIDDHWLKGVENDLF